MPKEYPVWRENDAPSTRAGAHVTRHRDVVDVLAIRVVDATYRDSEPITDVFELVTSEPHTLKGEERYEVYCAWFGVRPGSNFPRIAVKPGSFEIIAHYTGRVADNIST